VKQLYKVDVADVTITTRPAKKKGNGRLESMRGALKKATVTLKEGQTISIQ
jgi:ribosomal protein L23